VRVCVKKTIVIARSGEIVEDDVAISIAVKATRAVSRRGAEDAEKAEKGKRK
jgi:hypothetical protein